MFSETFDIDEAVDRLRGCSHLFFTENYEQGLAELAAKLDLPLRMRRERVSAKQVELTPNDLERLTALLQPEYEMIARLSGSTASD